MNETDYETKLTHSIRWENALFIGAAEVVKKYQQMFELMWEQN